MTYKLIIKPQAELDLLDSAQWYENRRKGLGSNFLDAVDDKLQVVIHNPLKYQLRYKSIRLALVHRFPFAIHFTVEEDKIYVLAVLSTYRNPKIWEE